MCDQGDTQRGKTKKSRKTEKHPPRSSMLNKKEPLLSPDERWLEWAISIKDVRLVGCLMCEVASIQDYNTTL